MEKIDADYKQQNLEIQAKFFKPCNRVTLQASNQFETK